MVYVADLCCTEVYVDKINIPEQTGKTIIVTGANTAIGYATALTVAAC